MALLDPNLIPGRLNGQTIDQTWFNILKTYLISFFDILTLNATLNTEMKFNFEMEYQHWGVTTGFDEGIHQYIVTNKMKLLTAKLQLGKVYNSTGSLEMDIKRKRGVGAFTTIFTIKPLCDIGQGDYEASDSGLGSSVDAIVDTVNEVLEVGDIVRFDLTTVPGAGAQIEERLRKSHMNLTFELQA